MNEMQLLEIMSEADCNSETCFIDSKGKYRVLGWAKKVAEISFKAGQESTQDAKTASILLSKLKQAVKDVSEGKELDLPEEYFEVFSSIQNQAIAETAAIKEAESQARVERITLEIEPRIVALAILLPEQDSKSLRDWWQALKKQEGL